MKKILSILIAWLLIFIVVAGGAERRSPRDFMIVGRDYNIFEDISIHPVSVGLTSWTDKGLGHMPAIYGSAAMLSYKDILRFETGMATTWDKDRGLPAIALVTGLSTLIAERIVVGAWYAPFWGLVKEYPDNPWGIMVGYAF